MKKEDVIKILERHISPKFHNLIWSARIERISEEIVNKMNDKK